MDKTVETFEPGVTEIIEQLLELLVAAHVTVVDQCGAELLRKFGNPVLESLAEVAECKFGAFPVARHRNAIGDRTIRQQTSDQ